MRIFTVIGSYGNSEKRVEDRGGPKKMDHGDRIKGLIKIRKERTF